MRCVNPGNSLWNSLKRRVSSKIRNKIIAFHFAANQIQRRLNRAIGIARVTCRTFLALYHQPDEGAWYMAGGVESPARHPPESAMGRTTDAGACQCGRKSGDICAAGFGASYRILKKPFLLTGKCEHLWLIQKINLFARSLAWSLETVLRVCTPLCNGEGYSIALLARSAAFIAELAAQLGGVQAYGYD